MSRLRAAIVGLGQVGIRFDLDAKRQATWTHFSAYERLPDEFELVAVCDVDPSRHELALARRPDLATFASLDELLDATPLDVVSICTPAEHHASQVEACAGRARAIVCEKPLSANAESGSAAVAACSERGSLLAVNYYKRFETAVAEPARLVESGAIGELRTVAALYSGPLDAVGSHAADLLHFLLGPLSVSHVERAAGRHTTTLRFGEAGVATLVETGPREDLVFEVELLGSEGRIRILDNCARYELFRFAPSPRYGGYRELVAEPRAEVPPADPFLSHFREVADVLAGRRPRLTSDGAAALLTQRTLDRIRDDDLDR